MTKARSLCAASLAFLVAATLAVPAGAALPPPPVAKTIPVTDTYFGTTVVDPYRWMETPGNPDLATYLKTQSERTRAILDAIPGRKTLTARLASLADTVTSSSGVIRRENAIFYERLAPGSSLPKLYVREGDGVARVLLDPATLGSGEHHLALAGYTPSDDGKLVAVRLTPDGNEPATFTRIYSVGAGTALPDTIEHSDFGVTGWRADGKALYYLRLQDVAPGAPPTAYYQNIRTFVHVLGRPQSEDRAVFGSGVSPDVAIGPNEFAIAAVDPESNFAFGLIVNGVQNEKVLYVSPKAVFLAGKPAWTKAFDYADGVTNATGRGDDLYLLSHENAPRFQILRTSASHPDVAHAAVVVAPSDRVIDDAAAAKDALYVFERENGIAHVVRVEYGSGAVSEILLPVAGTLSNETADPKYPGFIAKLEGFQPAL